MLGDALDRDPFLLFELRGRTRARALEALRAARGDGGNSETQESTPALARDEKPPSVALAKLSAKSYDAAPVPLPALSFSFEPPPAHASVLRQLGAPSSWNRESPPIETLAPLVQNAAAAARRLALSEPEPVPPPTLPPVKSKRRTSGR